MSDDGRIAVAGAYQFHGIAAYSVASGSEIWRRKDLKQIQQIVFSHDSSRVFCCFESGPCESLNALSGKSGRSLRGVRGIWVNPFGPVRFLERSRDYALAGSEALIATMPKISFSVLDGAFSPSQVCISEAGGPVRCFDLSSGVEVWHHAPPIGIHFLRLTFCENVQCFAGVSLPYERGGAMQLQFFGHHDGTPSVVADVGTPAEVEFCWNGNGLVTSQGLLFEVSSGRLIGTLSFPMHQTKGES